MSALRAVRRETMRSMEAYSRAAMERAMKVQDVMLQAMAKKITWRQGEEILGISDRHMRPWRERYVEGATTGCGPAAPSRKGPSDSPHDTLRPINAEAYSGAHSFSERPIKIPFRPGASATNRKSTMPAVAWFLATGEQRVIVAGGGSSLTTSS